jgi:hypothetical protein
MRLSAFPVTMIALGAALMLLGPPGTVRAQIEGEDRGIAPINSAGDFQAADILVEAEGENAFEARAAGWREAQRLGWEKLWRQTHGGAGASLPDSRLDTIVSAIEIVEEEIGPRHYRARVNVYFDRARAGQILGVSGVARRSAPLLVIPVQISGGAQMVFEQRTDWQRAWARYRTADSVIDYVRPRGAGAESLIVNAGQLGRRNREWWRVILEQFGAADVVMPVVEIERKYPGGPVVGRFVARAGPDNRRLGSFTLRVSGEEELDELLDEGIARLDAIYARALAQGQLQPDRSLVVEDPIELDDIELPERGETGGSANFDLFDDRRAGEDESPASGAQPSTGDSSPAGDTGGSPDNILPAGEPTASAPPSDGQ